MNSYTTTTTTSSSTTTTTTRQRRGFTRSWAAEPEEACDYVIKAILLGDLGVGKTSFLRAFLRPGIGGRRAEQRQASGGRRAEQRQASGQRVVLYQGKRVGVTLWDTAGQERYRTLTASYYHGAHACIVMYDVHNEESFDNVTMWLESVVDYRGSTSSGVHTVLVGAIRTTSTSTTSSARPVDRHRAQSLAHHYQIPHFVVDVREGTADPTPGGGGGGVAAGVGLLMESIVALVVSRALQSQQLSQSITPLNTRLRLLARKTRQSRCSRCCAV
ncbi:ras-related protein Rab-13-like [Babylonia areolata]|uniref:ras-related protein Rab-13-like n=1 Tax=Babylonia areolata TaxID=304850 RepID=UPI003FCF19AF